MANVLLRVSALVVAAFAFALVHLGVPESAARGERPLCDRCNVVLISFDTVRADHLGTYGYERKTSPNVDALAAKSVVFERAISQAPWTLPAHGSMLSGLYPSRLGVLRYPATRALPDKNPVLPEVFRAAGYATAGFTGGGFVSDHYGFDRGFDVYSSKGRRFEHNLDDTIDWLEQHKQKPFFLFVHGYDAHRPYYSKSADKLVVGLPADAEPDQNRFCLGDDRSKPDPDRLERVVRYYDASIHHGDRAIGVFLKTLEKMNLMQDTVILLTSDHGEEFFEHGNCDHVRFVYDESVHVPYMLYVPSLAGSTRRVDGLVPASISVARTLLDVVGLEHAMPGVTLLPLLTTRGKGFPVVYSEADSAAGSLGSRGRTSAITKPGIKLVSYDDEGTDEAYDLETDPGELEPLPERNSAYLMRQTLRAWTASLRPLPRPEGGAKPKSGKDDKTDDGYVPGKEPDAGNVSKLADPAAAGEPIAAPEPKPAGRRGRKGPDSAAPKADEPAAGGEAGSGRQGQEGQQEDREDEAGRDRPAGQAADEEEEMKVPKELEESLKSLGYLE